MWQKIATVVVSLSSELYDSGGNFYARVEFAKEFSNLPIWGVQTLNDKESAKNSVEAHAPTFFSARMRISHKLE